MNDHSKDSQTRYFREAAIVLAKEGFQLDEVHTDRLCISHTSFDFSAIIIVRLTAIIECTDIRKSPGKVHNELISVIFLTIATPDNKAL